jgi:hypothetical protein
MPLKPNQPRTICRRQPLLRTYILSSTEYDRLVADGLNPETVDDTELTRRADAFYDHDEKDRIVTTVAKVVTTVHRYP